MNTRRTDRLLTSSSREDIVARLSLDAGTRTIGELIQERQWALSEILRLRDLLSFQSDADRLTANVEYGSPPSPPLQTNHRELLSLKEVSNLFSISRATVYNLIKNGEFPAPVRITARSVRWRRIDLDGWQAMLKARARPALGEQ